MLAAYIEETGPPENIRIGELPAPGIGPTDVLVDVAATTVNRADALIRSGAYPTPMPFPFVVGRDLVGTVAAVGDGVADFAIGDRVWCNSLGHAGRQGPTAEQAAVPVDRLYHLPSAASFDDAVAVLHPAATAYLALFRHGRVRPGETVLVVGAAGNVGSAVTVMALEAGARVLAVARSEDAGYCRDLGASEVIDYRDSAAADQVRAAAPGGVDLILETSGVNDLATAVELLAFGGRIIVLAGVRSQAVLPAGRLFLKHASVAGFTITGATAAELAEAAASINRLLARGLLRPRSVTKVPIGAVADAQRRIEEDGLHGTRFAVQIRQERTYDSFAHRRHGTRLPEDRPAP